MLNMKAHDSPSCMTESSVDTDVPASTSLHFIENQTYFIISTQDQQPERKEPTFDSSSFYDITVWLWSEIQTPINILQIAAGFLCFYKQSSRDHPCMEIQQDSNPASLLPLWLRHKGEKWWSQEAILSIWTRPSSNTHKKPWFLKQHKNHLFSPCEKSDYSTTVSVKKSTLANSIPANPFSCPLPLCIAQPCTLKCWRMGKNNPQCLSPLNRTWKAWQSMGQNG